MATMMVQLMVKDFAAWKQVFETGDHLRKSNGEISHHIYQDVSDPKKVIALYQWSSAANAQSFFQSAELKAMMMEAGVQGPPSITFLNEA